MLRTVKPMYKVPKNWVVPKEAVYLSMFLPMLPAYPFDRQEAFCQHLFFGQDISTISLELIRAAKDFLSDIIHCDACVYHPDQAATMAEQQLQQYP